MRSVDQEMVVVAVVKFVDQEMVVAFVDHEMVVAVDYRVQDMFDPL